MEYQIQLKVDDSEVAMNAFVQDVTTNVVLGIIRSLNDVPDDPERIELVMQK